jgi:methionyl-tRNA synthetase
VIKFVNAKYGGIIPARPAGESGSQYIDQKFITDVNVALKEYYHSMEAIKICASLRLVMDISRLGNGYLQVFHR